MMEDTNLGGRPWRPATSNISVSAISYEFNIHVLSSFISVWLNLNTKMTYNVVDDLHVTREEVLHERDRPFLKSLRQNCVVGEEEHLGDEVERLVERHILLINKDAHQLGDRQRRVRLQATSATLKSAGAPEAHVVQLNGNI
jgi:hypothetical protein